MTFSGGDPHLMRLLARHIEGDVGPELRRAASVILDTLERQDMQGTADALSHRTSAIAMRLEDAADDLRYRASIIEMAQQFSGWGTTLSGSIRRTMWSEAHIALHAPYTGDVRDDMAAHAEVVASEHAARIVRDLTGLIDDGNAGGLSTLASMLDGWSDEAWFGTAMAQVFASIGPDGAARLVATLVSQPLARYEPTTLLAYANAFSAATRHGLGWTDKDIVRWFDHGAAGAAQMLRAPGLDAAFLWRVVQLIGLGTYDYRDGEAIPGVRRLLGSGSDIWHHVGARHADHRAVLLDALASRPHLAARTLDDATLERLLSARWPMDDAAALGNVLAAIQRHPSIDPVDAERISSTTLTWAAAGGDVPSGMRHGLAVLAIPHLGDMAVSLAIGAEVHEIASRPGLELPDDRVRRLLRLIAEDDAAFSELIAGYAGFASKTIHSPGGTHYEAGLQGRADELGALTFALLYTDREIRSEAMTRDSSDRLSALHVLEFLASTAVAVLPRPAETAAAFTVERILRVVKQVEPGARPDALEAHSEWKESVLADLEYLIALEMNQRGLLGTPVDLTEISRLEFLYLIESFDGPLEHVMTIIEAQARRQRETIEERD